MSFGPSFPILSLPAILLALLFWRWWPDLGLGFGAEQAPLGWLQSNWLMACATAAGIRATLPVSSRGWALLTSLIFLAAIDEHFMLHEQLQDTLADWMVEQALFDPRAAERLAQGLTGAYGLAGLLVAVWLRRVVDASAWPWLRAAIGVGVLAVAMDLTSDAIGPQIVEEVLEFVAEALMLCGLVTEVRSAACRSR